MIIVYQLTYIKYQTNERPQKFIKDYNNWRINFRIFLLFSCSCNLFIKLSILPQIEFCRLNYVVKP